MALLKVVCPGCAAVLKSGKPDGWAPDAKLVCPKCKTGFAAAEGKAVSHRAKPVEEPDPPEEEDDEEEEEKPKKKKKGKKGKGKKSGGGAYKTSPARFVILGVLLVIMAVLGYLLFLKKNDEKTGALPGPAALRA